MRLLIAIIAVTVAAGLAMPSPSFAAKSKLQTAMEKDKAANPQSFNACVALAKQRGYTSNDRSYGNDSARLFVEGCMQGKQN
jgi:sulfur relay (sulfurtransferase) complex TusBCD TusD component (DsrE family)